MVELIKILEAAAQQAPNLVVLVLVVIYFLRHMRSQDSRYGNEAELNRKTLQLLFAASEEHKERLGEIIERNSQAALKNAEAMARVAEVLDRHTDACSSVQDTIQRYMEKRQ